MLNYLSCRRRDINRNDNFKINSKLIRKAEKYLEKEILNDKKIIANLN